MAEQNDVYANGSFNFYYLFIYVFILAANVSINCYNYINTKQIEKQILIVVDFYTVFGLED